MGNRAVVCFANKKDVERYYDGKKCGGIPLVRGFYADHMELTGVYLHWNGGIESITGFCRACKKLGYRGGASDCYGVARFAQVVCNFFDGGLSCGVGAIERLDCRNGDNGLFVVDDEWQVVGREFAVCREPDRQREEAWNKDVDEFADYLVDITQAAYRRQKELQEAERGSAE